MLPMKNYLNARSLHSTRSTIATQHKSQTSLLSALALCAAMLAAGIPADAATRTPKATPPSSGTMAPTISPEESAAKGETLMYATVVPDGESATAALVDPMTTYTGTWTAYPFVKKFLTSFVAYNKKCQEVSHGSWYEGSIAPKYGAVTQSLVKGKLANGACSHYIFTAAGIYYKWVYKTNAYRNDEFKATWKGGGLTNYVTFHLKDR